MIMRSMNAAFSAHADQDALIVSFPAPVRILSWAVLNGGYCHASHVINHHISSGDRWFCADPERWLELATVRLGLQGKVVAMATAVKMKNLVQSTMACGDAEVTCFATVGCGNALSIGDPATVPTSEAIPMQLHTINLILTVQPGLSDEAMVEAIQLATEGRVRALHEAGIQSSISHLAATGTGTDCIAVVCLDLERERYCGKYTRLGEVIGGATYTAVKKGLALESSQNEAAPSGKPK
jgi:adenosylcobinamide amidohydrolase